MQHFEVLSSTNAYAINLLAKTTPSEGTVISSSFQEAGRGQIGSSWASTAGKNLLLSVILYPKWLAARQQFTLSQAVSLAVADTISSLSGKTALVKWPNDVYLEDKKLAGILIQNSLAGSYLQWSVVGVGLNVNEPSFSPDLTRAGSLLLNTGQEHDLQQVQHLLFQRLEHRYLQLKSNPRLIKRDYLSRLYRYQEWHTFMDPASQQAFTGQIIGVQENGKLAIQKEGGSVQYFDLKEVQFT